MAPKLIVWSLFVILSTEITKDELTSLIMSFNNAWNHVRLSLDQQGMSLRAVSLPYFEVTYNFVNCRNELDLLSNPLISLVRS